jgi:hypothetical protein
MKSRENGFRKDLFKKIEANRKLQEILVKEEFEMCKKYIQINCKDQYYHEAERTTGRGKNKKTYLEGRFYWMQDFKDQDTGKIIKIERSRPIKENDTWDEIAVVSLVM